MDIKQIIEIIKRNKTIAKYIDTDCWVSGCVTNVYPISVWLTDLKYPHIEIQLKHTAKEGYLRKAIEKIKVENSRLIKNMLFCKNDGSCPNTIRIYLSTNN